MEEIKVYNTLTKEKEVFKPITPGEVKIYVCGVTPYNHPHIGNPQPLIPVRHCFLLIELSASFH